MTTMNSPELTIFDVGEADALAYIAMEFVRGNDLSRHTASGHLLPLPQVLHTLARVSLALAHAHRQGIVHRDIKPANVMIDPSADIVKVTDFGVARIADACQTRTGLVLGTPSFMSPEQMAGRRVDGRTDLYSLGVMLFQLLTGALPHRSDSMAQLMHQIANEPAPDVRHRRDPDRRVAETDHSPSRPAAHGGFEHHLHDVNREDRGPEPIHPVLLPSLEC